eukprot:119837-Prymnesium_polylepis.3
MAGAAAAAAAAVAAQSHKVRCDGWRRRRGWGRLKNGTTGCRQLCFVVPSVDALSRLVSFRVAYKAATGQVGMM